MIAQLRHDNSGIRMIHRRLRGAYELCNGAFLTSPQWQHGILGGRNKSGVPYTHKQNENLRLGSSHGAQGIITLSIESTSHQVRVDDGIEAVPLSK